MNTNWMSGSASLRNTILWGNVGATAGTNGIVANDSWGPLSSLGHNLVGSPSDLSVFDDSDLFSLDPRMGPVQDNGGPTPTHALLAHSSALDAGTASGLPYDQRGQLRPVDNSAWPNRPGSDGTDIGALEWTISSGRQK